MPVKLPNALPRPAGELERLEAVWRTPRGWRFLTTVNNTNIGLLYIATALVFLALAGVLALLMRAQLAFPDATLLDARTYNQVFTMHGSVMMFLFAVPIVEAVAVYLLPGMLGARDLPFPRLSAYAYWAYALGGLAFFCTLFFGVAPDGGWFMYPPLTGPTWSPGPGPDFWLLGIGFIEISAIAGAIELIVGILFTRAPGMTLSRMPVFAWAMLVVGVMIVFAFPAIIAATALLEVERAFDWPIFDPQRGGQPLLWQHLFWFFGHPDVYIIFLPAAGLVSMMVPVAARTPLAGYPLVVAALLAVCFFSFALWVHHMFTAGVAPLSVLAASAASMAVAVPTGIQVFSWLATLARGELRWTTSSLFLLGFLFVFVLGGLTGVMVAVVPFDVHAHDTHFVVAHLHYVLIGGMVLPVIAALYHWMPLVKGRALSERLGRWVFGLVFAGVNVAFFPLHVVGLQGMPRRVYTYPADVGWHAANLVATIGAFVLAAGFVLLFFDLVRTMRGPRRPHGNPWGAATLEWLPNGDFGTRSIPQVESRDPLWHRPQLAAEVEAGAHWLPGTVSGRRETLVTSPAHARIDHLIVLPGDSWLPLLGAIGTAAFFYLLTLKHVVPALAAGAVAAAAIAAWLWQGDRAPFAPRAIVGDGVEVAVGGRRSTRIGWWAMAIAVTVDLVTFGSLLFAHGYVAMMDAVCPPAGSALPPARYPAAAGGAWIASSIALACAVSIWRAAQVRGARASGERLRGVPFRGVPFPGVDAPGKRGRIAFAALVVLAALFACAGWTLDWRGHDAAGLAPAVNAWSATVATLLGYTGLHAIAIVAMAAWLVARMTSGLLHHASPAALDVLPMFWHAAVLQAIAAIAVVQWLPRL